MANFKLVISDKKPNRVKVSINQLAQITGYTPSHISRIFSKQTVPSMKCISKLAKALQMSIDDLYNLIKEGKINVSKINRNG